MIIVLLAGVFAAIFPVTAKNYIVGDKLVLISQNGGFNFYIGNALDASGTLTHPESLLRIAPDLYSMEPHEVAEIEWFRLAAGQLLEKPLHFPTMFFKKLLLFFVGYEIPNNINHYLSERFSGVLRLPLLTFWVALPLAVTGMLVSLKEWPRQALLLLFMLTYTVSIAVIFVVARFRLPVVPFLLIFAGYAIVWWHEKIQKREAGKIALSLIPLLLLGAFGFMTRSDHIRENDYSILALAYEEQGRRDLAAREYENAIEVDPLYSVARDRLVECYIALGKPDRALEAAIEGAKLEPKSPDKFLGLAHAFKEMGEPEPAIGSLEWALVMNPQYIQARRELARLHEEQGNPEAALAQWLEVFKADPADEEALEKLKTLQPRTPRM